MLVAILLSRMLIIYYLKKVYLIDHNLVKKEKKNLLKRLKQIKIFVVFTT